MIQQFSRVVLTKDLSIRGISLRAGDVGAVVQAYENEDAFVVEFFSVNGDTIAVETVRADQLRPVTDRDVLQARAMV